MSFWTWFDGGESYPRGKTWRSRFALRIGRYLATRHKRVTVAADCSISPEAKINPRGGAISIGARSVVSPHAVIQGNVSIGEDSSVQTGTILVGYGSYENPKGLIKIGNKVRIAPQVMMIAANHNFNDLEKSIHDQGLTHEPITIEDDVWVAGRVTITAGVTIGKGSVIAAGAVVTKDVAPYSIMGGVPAKLIRSRLPPETKS